MGVNYQPQLVSLPDFWTINSMTHRTMNYMPYSDPTHVPIEQFLMQAIVNHSAFPKLEVTVTGEKPVVFQLHGFVCFCCIFHGFFCVSEASISSWNAIICHVKLQCFCWIRCFFTAATWIGCSIGLFSGAPGIAWSIPEENWTLLMKAKPQFTIRARRRRRFDNSTMSLRCLERLFELIAYEKA